MWCGLRDGELGQLSSTEGLERWALTGHGGGGQRLQVVVQVGRGRKGQVRMVARTAAGAPQAGRQVRQSVRRVGGWVGQGDGWEGSTHSPDRNLSLRLGGVSVREGGPLLLGGGPGSDSTCEGRGGGGGGSAGLLLPMPTPGEEVPALEEEWCGWW